VRALRIAVVACLLAAAAEAGTGTFYWMANPSVYEAPSVTLGLNRYGGSTGTVTVDYTTVAGTAIAGTDYTAASGTITFADGETYKSIQISLVDDTVYRAVRTFTVVLSNPTNGAAIGSSTISVTIFDNDPVPGVSINDVSLTEGNSGSTNAVFTVTLTGSTTLQTIVNWYTSDGSASSYGSQPDFHSSSGILTFNPGETQKTISIPVYGDTIYEGNEYFSVYLYPSNASVTVTRGYGSCTILNDDSPPVVTVNDVTIPEGNSGTALAHILVKASQPIYGYIDYTTVPGNATPGRDFTAVSGDLYFYYETEKQITIPINGDTDVEPDEQFKLHFVPTSYSLPFTMSKTDITVTIVNDDIGLGPPTQNVAKGANGSVFLDMGNPPATPQTFAVATSNPCIKAPSSVTLGTSARSVSVTVSALSAPCTANVSVALTPQYGGKTLTATVQTYLPLDVAFDPPSLQLYVGQSLNVKMTASPLDAPVAIPLQALGATVEVPASINLGTSGASFAVKALKVGPIAINATLPAQNGGGTAVLYGDVLAAPTAVTLLQVSPASGPTAGGTNVSISGANLRADCTLAFGGVPAAGVAFGSASSMTATTPAHAAGAVAVTATCGSETFSLANAFTYLSSAPALTGVTPSFGSVMGGTLVRISGRDLEPSCWAFFDGVAARNVSLASSSEMSATTPAHAAAAVRVSLRCKGGTEVSLPDAFSYSVAGEPAPVITSIDPLAAAPGQLVTITGSRFRTTDRVTFDSTPAQIRLTTPVANGDTHRVSVPTMPLGKVSINVTDASGRVSTTGPIFTVLEGITPQVTKLSPASLPAGGELTVDGSGFRPPYTFTIGDVTARLVTMSYSQAIVRVPALAPGTYALNVVNGSGQTAALGGNVTVTSSGIVVASASPMCVTSDGGTPVAIAGSGFAAGATVTIGGVAATNIVVVDAAHIVATLPALAPGWPAIVVTNPADGSGTATNALRVYSPLDPDGCGIAPRPRPAR
jgi:hypothetical protein